MTSTSPPGVDTVILDLDGTLVDSVYVHTLAWRAAFRDVGVEVASHRIHRAIGMGGDRLVAHVTDDRVESAVGDTVRERHAHHLDDHFHDIVPVPGATELLEALRSRVPHVVLASSGDAETTGRLLDLVEGADVVLQHVVSGADAESKPAGDLIEAALRSVGSASAVVIGDAVWDAEAAARAGVPSIGLLSGGFSRAELTGAGCTEVYDTPVELARRIETSLIGRCSR